MEYSVTIQELIKMPIIRNDFYDEWMNKMSDCELTQYDKETYELCLNDGVLDKFPDMNIARLTKLIDRNILYEIFKNTNQ